MKRHNYIHRSKYFYGNKISDYGLERGYVDYRTLALSFDAILNCDIMTKTSSIGYWDLINGSEYYYENDDGHYASYDEYLSLSVEEQDKYHEYFKDVFQWFIISSHGSDILTELTDEIVYYNEELDMYVWGVTHYGTSWDYVLTNIKIDISTQQIGDE